MLRRQRTLPLLLRLALSAWMALALAGLAAPASLGRAACDPSAPVADLSVNQTASPGTNGGVVYAVTIVNKGPCNAPGAKLTDTLPPGVTVVSIQTNPNSWVCTGTTGTISCLLTATIGVPGDTSVYIQTAPPPPTGSITNTVLVEFVPPGSTTDPNPGDNTSWGAYAANGGTVTAGPPSGPTSGFKQTTKIVVPPGHNGSVQIQQGLLSTPCPSSFPNCFGQPVSVGSPSTSSTDPQSFVFSYDASLPGLPSYGQLTMLHQPDGSSQWFEVLNCKKGAVGAVPDPCISSIVRLYNPALVTPANPRGLYFQITVLTSQNGNWRG